MINKINNIKDIFKELDLEELKYKDKDFEIEFRKKSANLSKEVIVNNENIASEKSNILLNEENENLYKVKSPIVGIYYNKPASEEEKYVDINSKVKKGDVLCVIEAMKMFNEVKSPVSGTIKKINFSNESLVSVEDILFEIEE